MLSKKNRISRASFDTILKDGAFFHSPHISLRIVRAQNDLPKFSFIVSKKVSKSAVLRNLLRRRGYSTLKVILKDRLKEKMKPSILGAFFLKKGAERLKPKEFQDEIALLLKKSKVL
jgi:ribonuclease P protein component